MDSTSQFAASASMILLAAMAVYVFWKVHMREPEWHTPKDLGDDDDWD